MIASPSLFQTFPRPLLYLVTVAWLVFGLAGWSVVALVVYWDNERQSPIALAPLVTEGCSSVKWMPPPENP